MKRYSVFLVNPITIIFILIALIFNKFNFLILHYSIAFIHEICHYFAAKVVKIKVQEIQFLPIGFYLKINNLENYSFFKQLVVLIAGPLSYFISFAILKLLYRYDVLSIYGYEEGILANNFILLFNLLPIYPLDGAKILELIMSKFLSEYKLRIFRILVSILTLVLASSYLLSLGELITVGFLFIGLIGSLINLKKDYLYFLIYRLNAKNDRKVKINKEKVIYRLSDNYCLSNNQLICEKEIIQDILKQENLKKEIN